MKRALLMLLAGGLMVFSLVSIAISFGIEKEENPLLAKQMQSASYGEMYDAYINREPITEDRFRQENLGVTALFVIDFISEESEEMYTTLSEQLENEFVSQGTLAIGHKYYITKEEYEEKKGRFIYAQASRCYQASGATDTRAFITKLFNTAVENVEALLKSAGISECTSDQSVYEDAIESDLYLIQAPSLYIGIGGKDNTVLYGNPSWTRVQRTVRNHQIDIGI